MKKLAYLIKLLLLGAEHDLEYTKDTCNRTYHDNIPLVTDTDRKNCWECNFSRWEVYDKDMQRHIAHIAYDPSECYIIGLRVNKKYRKQGIGKELAHKAIEDMRAKHNCREISLISTSRGEKFWENLGAKPGNDFRHYFS